MIVAYIDSYKERFGVEPICAVLTEHGITIAPSTYHAHKAVPISPAALEDAYTANALYTLWAANWGVYGARKLWHAARKIGIDVGRDQVARLMKLAGIRGITRGRHTTRTTVRDDIAARHPDLVKRAWHAPTRTDELWVADFYVWTLVRVRVRRLRRRRLLSPCSGLEGLDIEGDVPGHRRPAPSTGDSKGQ